MRAFVNNHKYYFLLGLIFLVAELLVNPIADLPLNDDWTYGKSVLILKNEGKIDIGAFAAMTLFSHLVWGFAFVKLFGFSFTVLRFSTLISSLIGIFVLNKLLSSITKNKVTAFIGCLVLLFNPLYFNLSNTYMTDVNFNTLLLLCCYFAHRFYETRSLVPFVLVFVMSSLLVLIRQFGIVVPICFTLSVLFMAEKRWLYTGLALVLTCVVYGVFKYYEGYLKGMLVPYASYKFSGQVNPGSSAFWDLFFYNLGARYKQILVHLLVYTFPLVLIFSGGIIRRAKKMAAIAVTLLSFTSVYFLLRTEAFPFHNVFTNMSLGAETFYETLSTETKNYRPHTFAPDFENCMTVVKYLFSGGTLSLLLLFIIERLGSGERIQVLKPELVFSMSFFCAYVFLILITESYFDRYHLPLISILILLFGFLYRDVSVNYKYTIPLLLGMFYISVFGTKDYLELNRTRWKAYHYLRHEKQIPADKINGGFEVNCWNEGQYNWWYDFLNLDNFDYLIQYRDHSGFKPYKSFEFQRCFPLEKDQINIFVREGIEVK